MKNVLKKKEICNAHNIYFATDGRTAFSSPDRVCIPCSK